MRTVLIIAVLSGLGRAALADVVILRDNDIPLQGRILAETDTSITFQIRGLGDGAKMEIMKSRVRRFWREENSYFEYLQAEKTRMGSLGRLGPEKEPAAAKAVAAPAEPPPPPRSARSAAEVRAALLGKAWDRLRSAVPGSSILRVLLCLLSILCFAGLLHTGGRVAGLRRLGLQQAGLLSLITHLLVITAVAAPRTVLRPEYLPVLVTGEVLVWLLLARLLAGAALSRVFLLFSFCLGSTLFLGGSVFSVLTVL
jgi:hypothetical protein